MDAKSGAIRWQAPRKPYRACYSTPFMLNDELIVGSTAGLTGYEPKSGTELWHWEWHFDKSPLRTVASPVAANGMIFANSGDGGGDRHTVAVRVNGHGQDTKPELAWESKRVFGYVPCMLVHGEHLFFVNDMGVAACHVARTGANVWTERLGGNVSASPILVNGRIYAVNEEGTTYVFPAAGKFELLAKNELGEPVMATPAVANGRLFIRGRQHLYCLGTR
jgi:outer membrane protein assembly factor BamB